MENHFLNGEWIGYFTYGEMYPENIRSLKSGFEMKLDTNGDQINGVCFDDDMKGRLDTPANINGKINPESIHFTKQYPFFFSIDARGNVIKDESKTPSTVNYSGNYDAASNSVNGKWQISMIEMNSRNEQVEKTVGGNWSMKKK
jgi:hypothetical protein